MKVTMYDKSRESDKLEEVKEEPKTRKQRPLIKLLISVLIVIVSMLLIDTAIHQDNYSWSTWTDTLSEEQVSFASSAAARYQLSDALLDYPDTRATKRFYSIERKYAAKELRAMGYRGTLPSPDWPSLN